MITHEVIYLVNFKKMTSEDVTEFFHQVRRKGKALSLPPEQLEKYRVEYDKIIVYIKENYKGFLFYHISGGSNMLNMNTLKRACKVIEGKGVFRDMKAAFKKGDVEELKKQCGKLHPIYCETVNQLLWENKQKK